MFKQRSYKFPRRFWHFLALGVPWILGVGILVAAQHAQGGAWLMRGLIDLATGPSASHDASEARQHKVARQLEEKSYARGFRFEPGQHVATVDAVGSVGVVPPRAPLAHLDGLNAVEPQVWASIDRAEIALGDALRHDELADLQRSRAEIRLAVEQARRATAGAAMMEEAERALAAQELCEVIQPRVSSRVGKSFRIVQEPLAPKPRKGPHIGIDG
jgi:hypothetical protein